MTYDYEGTHNRKTASKHASKAGIQHSIAKVELPFQEILGSFLVCDILFIKFKCLVNVLCLNWSYANVDQKSKVENHKSERDT